MPVPRVSRRRPAGPQILTRDVAALAASPPAFARRPHPVIAYVLHGDAVTPIQTATGRPGHAIRVGVDPMAIAITPDGKTAYVVNFGSGTVTPISTATNGPGRAIRVGRGSWVITITPWPQCPVRSPRPGDSAHP